MKGLPFLYHAAVLWGGYSVGVEWEVRARWRLHLSKGRSHCMNISRSIRDVVVAVREAAKQRILGMATVPARLFAPLSLFSAAL